LFNLVVLNIPKLGDISLIKSHKVITMKLSPSIELSSDLVKLVPLGSQHLAQFYEAGKDPILWRWAPPHQCRDLATAKTWLDQSLAKVAAGEHVAFAIFDRQSGEMVGSTRYCSIDTENKGIEIGFTFITPKFQRSYINTHAKYLLLTHAFEQLGVMRVQFRTHQDNHKSRNAIARLGASFEGVVRNQRMLVDGERRHTAQFSITDDDWPQVKRKLAAKLTGKKPDKSGVALDVAAQQVIEQAPLAQLTIANGDNMLAQTIYLPMSYDPRRRVLVGHLSTHNKLNGLLAHNPRVNLIFHGQDCYVSPTWHEAQLVPTWNYQRLHLQGTFRLVAENDKAKKLDLLAQQVAVFERSEWDIRDQPAASMAQMAAHICCFEISVSEQQLVEKVSMKKPQFARDAIAEQMDAQGKASLAALHR